MQGIFCRFYSASANAGATAAVLPALRIGMTVYCLTERNTFSIRCFFMSSEIELYAQADAGSQPMIVACMHAHKIASPLRLLL